MPILSCCKVVSFKRNYANKSSNLTSFCTIPECALVLIPNVVTIVRCKAFRVLVAFINADFLFRSFCSYSVSMAYSDKEYFISQNNNPNCGDLSLKCVDVYSRYLLFKINNSPSSRLGENPNFSSKIASINPNWDER